MDKTKGIGDVKASQRYQSLDNYLKKNQGMNELIGHSLGGSVVLEKQQQDPSYTTYTYGAPVISFGNEGSDNINRYRTKYDYFSIFCPLTQCFICLPNNPAPTEKVVSSFMIHASHSRQVDNTK